MISGTLQEVFTPRTIAVIGASREPTKLGHVILMNLIEGGFKGKIFAINPRTKEILGLRSYSRIEEVSSYIDMAIVVVPAAFVPKVVEDCGKKGVKAAIVISAGFREIGSKGEDFEQETLREARRWGIRIMGPNCLGIINASKSLDATISRVVDPKKLRIGSIAFVSQSGALGASLYSWAQTRGIGFDKLVSLGNMCDIDESEVLEYLATDAGTKVISMYIEGVRDGRKFVETAKKVSLSKPIVIMKIGRSVGGAKAARSHTGTLSGSDSIYEGAFKQCGAIRAGDTAEMFDFAKAFATQPLPRGKKIVVVTNAGGPGVAATDVCDEVGLELAELDKGMRERIGGLVPSFASVTNPVDTTPQVSPKVHGDVLKILLSSKGIDGAISVVIGSRPRAFAQAVINAHTGLPVRYNKPVLLCWIADKSAEDMLKELEEKGVPVYETPERAVKSMGALKKYEGFLKKHSSLVHLKC